MLVSHRDLCGRVFAGLWGLGGGGMGYGSQIPLLLRLIACLFDVEDRQLGEGS